ncbi:MAG: nicotinate (nicotinamide) nucleotide adenylyltransferase [Endomicrobia bacterium]|nr:nicotinate (nicotinamide) nucleotide adenylyltransferase [Endomicrobiia bacterium]MCL2799168.1 nicotinate (nicotinamide) nucleotide adenylyltransferase [Endomicrobiia bacterium]
MGKIAVFGGSFDPPHKAHIQIAKEALSSFDLKKIIFVIAYAPPHKVKLYADISDRIAMLKLALESESPEKTEIGYYEVEQGRKVYSYETLDHFKKIYPDDEIFMIIGSDSLLDLPNWKNIEYLASQYKFIVAKRPGAVIERGTKFLERCLIIDKEMRDISSTEIRDLVSKNNGLAADFTDEKVYDYIKKQKLYSGGL